MDYQCIDIADSIPLLEKGAQIFDIRDPVSFENGHITNAVHITNENLAEYIDSTDSSTPIIVCCYHGNSSKNAAAYLSSAGFKEVYSLNGGFSQWETLHPDLCEQG